MLDHTHINREIYLKKQEVDITQKADRKANHEVIIKKETIIIQIFMLGE